MIRIATTLAVLCVLAGAGSAGAATLQQVGSFDRPVYVTSSPSNPDRLFVVERAGRVIEVVNGQSSVFADLSSEVGSNGEGGLLSIALAPDFANSGRFYLFYADRSGAIQIAEMRASGSSAPLSSLRGILTIAHPGSDNHYGGQLQIGPEGLLYASTGDGELAPNAQDKSIMLGKILRLDPTPSGLLQYTVPAGNPFAGGETAGDDLTWSYGLRNPFRFSFDPGGAMLIGEVGQSSREEVDYAPPGAGGLNYGWACREGTIDGPRAGEPECASPPAVFTGPIFEYAHAGAEPRCAIVGGYVVRDRSLGDLYGRYLYGDYCGSQLRSFVPDASAAVSDRGEGIAVSRLVSFGEDSCGRLYTVQEGGRVARLVNDPASDTCAPAKPRSASYVGIRAQGRRVNKGKRAQITAWVSPCAGRRGEPVKLMRGRKQLGTRRLDRACSVRFRPKISRGATFRALVGEDANYVAASSRKLRIKVLHRKQAKKPKRQARRSDRRS